MLCERYIENVFTPDINIYTICLLDKTVQHVHLL